MQPNLSLKKYTTMQLGGPARVLTTAKSREDIVSFVDQAEEQHIPLLVIGAGSNIIVKDEGFSGMVILNRIPGFEVVEDTSPNVALIKAGSGMVWDELVKETVALGLSGIENLSAIPGYVGAAPIQNIGAYGQEIANTLTELEAYDVQGKKFVTLKNGDCNFTYRESIFNSTEKNRYIIVSITLELSKQPQTPPFYDSLQRYLESQEITDYSPRNLRHAVQAIRAERLPDPSIIANTGSFFKNPIVEKWKVDQLKELDPDMPLFDMGSNLFKLSAGWLIEKAGLKGLEMNGMALHKKNSLVLINQNAASYQQLDEIRRFITEAVYSKFQLQLEQEPEEIDS